MTGSYFEPKQKKKFPSFSPVETKIRFCPTRSKGFLWLGGRDLQYGEWSQAGAVASLECGGIWLGCAMEEAQPKDSEAFIKDMKVGPEALLFLLLKYNNRRNFTVPE